MSLTIYNLGILLVSITLLGYFANWINWKFLRHKFIYVLYFIGAFIHEFSHSIFCLLTGAKMTEFKVFSKQPHITYLEPKLKYIGRMLISLAPIIGGLAFLFVLNKFWLNNSFNIIYPIGYEEALLTPFHLIGQINLLNWQSYIMILLFLNIGAMIGPSIKDLKNIWPILIVFFFIQSTFFDSFLYLTFGLILTNILIQFVLITLIQLTKFLLRR